MNSKPISKGAMYDAMCAEAIARYPNEACGLIVAKGARSKLIVCENISEHPDQSFSISHEQYEKASEVGEIIGVWHTHPNKPAVPSDADLASMEVTAVPWHIMSVRHCESGIEVVDSAVFEPAGFKMPLLGRPYVYGVFDCYTLAIDYYREEFGIELPMLPHTRVPRFWEKGLNLMEQEFENAGFVRIFDDERDLRVGDLLLMQCSSTVPNHVAVYIGDDMIIHHCQDRLSVRCVYGGSYWQKHTTHHLRHKEKLA